MKLALLLLVYLFIICGFCDDLDCLTANSCIGLSLVTNIIGDAVNGRGYKSNFGSASSITSFERTRCVGVSSCMNISYIDSGERIECDADNSCAFSASIEATTEIQCRASNACSYSTLKAVFEVKCEGSYSCSHSYVILYKFQLCNEYN